MKYTIEVENLSKKIDGKTILKEVTLQVKEGEIYGLLGANGAGKTSLMKILYRLIQPTSGKIMLLGEEIQAENNGIFAKVGSIIEMPIFYNEFTAHKNLELHCNYMKCPQANIDDTLLLFGLANVQNKSVRNFSLGMKQRLALARAVITKPKVLILDEPINGLDPKGIIEVRELLLAINREQHTTILLSSHILGELEKMVDTVGIIDEGELLSEISVSEIQKKEVDLETYYINLIEERMKHGKINSIGA